MTSASPDPPLSLREAEDRFGEFLSSNGYPSRVRWILEDQIAVETDRRHFVRAHGADEALAEAQRRYRVGLEKGLGILLQAICATSSETISNVYLPVDATDAQRRMIRPGLKLSCPTAPVPTVVIESESEWRTLKLSLRERAGILREAYDL
jgi:hypothetical protein